MEKCINDYFIMNDEAYGAEEFKDIYKVEGKCIYEVIRIIEGIPLFMKEHLKRFENSLKLVKSECEISMDIVEKYTNQLIVLNKVRNGNIKIVINEKNLYIFSIPAFYPTDKMYEKGVKTILFFGERANPNAKVINDEFRNSVNAKIAESDSFEAILINRDGYITEGSKSNIFEVKGDVVYTAPLEGVLPGITREKIIEACRELNLTVEEKNISHEDIIDLDGLFISGTSPKVLPIKEVENIVSYDSICPVIKDIKTKFDEIIKRNLKNYEGI